MDGYLDTCDGLNSYQSKEKRLEILKDSNSGAFAIIGGLSFMVLSVGFCSEINLDILKLVCLSYPLSRALSALAVMCFPQAREKGLSSTFSKGADKLIVKLTMIVYIIAVFLILSVISLSGFIIISFVSLLMYLYHYYNCMHNFGGITGDLAGFFLEIYELVAVIALVTAHLFNGGYV